MATEQIHIATAPPYDVIVGRDALSHFRAERKGLAFIVTDATAGGYYYDKFADSLKSSKLTLCRFDAPAGEAAKSSEVLLRLLEAAANAGMSRSDCFIGLGGGAVCDLTGFAASVYMRGVEHLLLPTTLLAMVDAAVGGKTAINLGAGKNLAGTFRQPKGVVCDTDTLRTLPKALISDGMAEVVKYAFLTGGTLYKSLSEGNPPAIEAIISECVRIKGRYVEKDEKDRGIRMLLNFGHTVGHAVEKLSGYTIPHGSCVAIGMCVISRGTASLGLCDKSIPVEIERLLRCYELPTETDYSAAEIAEAVHTDKKRSGGLTTLVIPLKPGTCVPLPIDDDGLLGLIGRGL